jgi:predicted nucleic acid-binding protein
MANQKLNLLQLAPCLMAGAGAVLARISASSTTRTLGGARRLFSKIHVDKGFGPEKLRDLHFDLLIALTAKSAGARLVTSNRDDFELIASYHKLQLEIW